MTKIFIKRVYEPPAKNDGFRILVDRLWPRGLKKESTHADLWMKEIAPSSALRKWFNHEPEKWVEFCKKYRAELRKSPVADELVQYGMKYKTITLLYSAKDEQHNQALVLQQFINEILGKSNS